MKIVTVQIGNSDDKLKQEDWAKFAEAVEDAICHQAEQIHFSGASNGLERWQNAAWVFEIAPGNVFALQTVLATIGGEFHQDAIAWTEGETLFI